MLVLNHDGVISCYYVEKECFTVVVGFIRTGSSDALVSLDTTDFHIEGKEGNWLAYDSVIVDGKEFFLMEHTAYGASATNVVLDESGKLIVDYVRNGFDEAVLKQIKEYLRSAEIKPRKIGKRFSILDRLHQKQVEIAARSGKTASQMAVTEDMDRRRK